MSVLQNWLGVCKMVELLKILTDYNGKYVAIEINNGLQTRVVPYEEVPRNQLFNNAILCKNGVIRGKDGVKIPREVIIKDTTKISLRQFTNFMVYDGTMDKYGISYDNKYYIVKPREDLDDSSIFSEYVASHFINNLGFEAHNTELVDTDEGMCVVIEDFMNSYGLLRPFSETKQSSEGTNIENKGYTYEDIQKLIRKHTKVPDEFKPEALKSFWNMFFLDAILGNRDRHAGNWGYIVLGEESEFYRIAPLYDNGASLFPSVIPKLGAYKRNKFKFLYERCEKFPACLIKDEGKRTNYYYFVNKKNLQRFDLMYEAYKRFKSIGVFAVKDAIVKAVSHHLIPDDLKEFYKNIVIMRYLHIIDRIGEAELRRYFYGAVR